MTDSLALTCEWCGRPLPPRGSRGPWARYCRASCRQRAYEARLIAKAVAGAGRVRDPNQPPDATVLAGLASRLEQLAEAQEAARAEALSDDPDYAAAFELIFAAVALLSPLYAAAEIRRHLR